MSTTFDAAHAYPLSWPEGRPRTPESRRRRWPHGKWTVARAREELAAEVERLGGRGVILSTNVELRLDGVPYSNRRTPSDPGVALWLRLHGEPHVFACDAFQSVEDNIRAITRHIEALRGIDRWGVGDLRQAFAGYRALPPPPAPAGSDDPWAVLGLSRDGATSEGIRERYRELSKQRHPDQSGGSNAAMAALTAARDRALAEVVR